MHHRRIITLACALILGMTCADADDVLKATVVYTAPAMQSVVEAKAEAVRRARVEALASRYGTLVGTVTTTRMDDGRVDFRSTGISEVKGEWMRDARKPRYDIVWDDTAESLVITCMVEGVGRELASSQKNFQATTLRNSTDVRSASTEFNDGDNIYLTFHSVSDGYVAVFLMDDAENVHTCLPYSMQRERGGIRVRGGHDYVFFSKAVAEPDIETSTAQYRLSTSRRVEINRLCIVFSPLQFTRCKVERDLGSTTPRVTPFVDFDHWLFGLRMGDPGAEVQFIDLTIKKI